MLLDPNQQLRECILAHGVSRVASTKGVTGAISLTSSQQQAPFSWR